MGAATYRKLPVVIEAVQWRGNNLWELHAWGAPVTVLPASNRPGIAGDSLIVGTLEDGPNGEAVHVADCGDWIIKGVKGELYPCKPDIFAATYEPVTPPASDPPTAAGGGGAK